MIFTLMICFLESRKPIFVQIRVGKDKKAFKLLKFRTMKCDTPSLASHLINKRSLTKFGGILRSLKIDELPQLWSVLVGDMSLIGPRPSLHNQYDLIKMRTDLGIHKLRPGITGWAQINGRDDVKLEKKVSFDEYYLRNYSFKLDLKIFFLTIYKILIIEGAY